MLPFHSLSGNAKPSPFQDVCEFQGVFSSVQFSRSVMSDSLWPHESQHARPPCPSPSCKLTSIESVMTSSHLILCCPLVLLPPIPPSIRVFSKVLASTDIEAGQLQVICVSRASHFAVHWPRLGYGFVLWFLVCNHTHIMHQGISWRLQCKHQFEEVERILKEEWGGGGWRGEKEEK